MRTALEAADITRMSPQTRPDTSRMGARRARPDDGGRGFSAVELIIVVLITAVLLALAVPTFVGAENKAKDRAAQTSARNALTNAKTIFAATGVYSDVDVTKLSAALPSLHFLDGETKPVAPVTYGPKTVSVLSTATTWYGAVLSDTGTCFYVVDSVDPNSAVGSRYAKVHDAASGSCVASTTVPEPGAYRDKW